MLRQKDSIVCPGAVLGLALLASQAAAQYEPVDCAFGENASWVVLYRVQGNNRWVAKSGGGLPPGLTEAIQQVSNEGFALTGVGMDGKAGWTVSYESSRKGYTKGHNVYESVNAKIKELHNEGWIIKDLALTSGGGYLMIYGQSNYREYGWTYSNVPQTLADKLEKIKAERGYPTGCGISPSGGWVLIYTYKNSNKWYLTSDGFLPADAAQFINEKF